MSDETSYILMEDGINNTSSEKINLKTLCPLSA